MMATPTDEVIAITHLFEINRVWARRDAIAATITTNFRVWTTEFVSP
jgi:hypothetical protein